MVLGFIQALALIYEFFTKKYRLRIFSIFPDNIRIWFSRIVTYLFFGGSLVFFFSPDISTAFDFFANFNKFQGLPDMFIPLSIQPYLVPVFIIIVFIIELFENDYSHIFKKMEGYWLSDKMLLIRWAFYSLLITIIIAIGSEVEQFVYVSF